MNITVSKDNRREFSTGMYQNFGEEVSFRYVSFQIRGIGQVQFTWDTWRKR